MEATIELFIFGLIMYVVLFIIVGLYKILKGSKLEEENLGSITTFIIDLKEDYEWNGF